MEEEQVNSHLSGCARCRELAEKLANRASLVESRMAAIAPSAAAIPRYREARPRLTSRIAEKENKSMLGKLFAPRYRAAWVAAGLVAVLAIALAFPPVRAAANSFLGLFRVQQFSVVQVNPGNLPQQLGSSAQLEAFFTNNVDIVEKGEPQEVASAEEASQLAGIPVRLPEGMNDQPDLMVMPGADISFNVDMDQARLLLDEIGRTDISLPEGLDGAQVSVSVNSAVTAMYGDCEFDPESLRQQGYDPDDQSLPRLPKCTTLAQMTSPTISAPPGFDVQQIGEAFLQVMGMSAEEAARFAQTVDWTTTLVIPIPQYGTTFQDVPVDGVNGTLILEELDNHQAQYLLIWVKDDILYSLTGPGDASTALRIASGIR
jgi:hypothetical protein